LREKKVFSCFRVLSCNAGVLVRWRRKVNHRYVVYCSGNICAKNSHKSVNAYRSYSKPNLSLFVTVHTCLYNVHEYECRLVINPLSLFTTRRHASAVYAVVVCLSVCLSVTSRCSTETAKRRFTQTTPHDSPGTLVFWRWISRQNSNGIIPNENAKCRWGRLELARITRTRKRRPSACSVVNFVRSQVYHIEATNRPPLFAARLPWCRASATCWYLFDIAVNRGKISLCDFYATIPRCKVQTAYYFWNN